MDIRRRMLLGLAAVPLMGRFSREETLYPSLYEVRYSLNVPGWTSLNQPETGSLGHQAGLSHWLLHIGSGFCGFLQSLSPQQMGSMAGEVPRARLIGMHFVL
jgi:hypothetical protein